MPLSCQDGDRAGWHHTTAASIAGGLVIHHAGAKSGSERFSRGDGRFPIVASHGGPSGHRAWYCNLKASPGSTVEVGAQTFTALPEELDETVRAGLWPTLVARARLGENQARTTRQIPVFRLTRPD